MGSKTILRARRLVEDIRARTEELDELLTRFETAPASALEVESRRDDKLLLTVPEAALRLNVSRTALYEMVLRGEVRSLKLGKSRRIPVAELERFVREISD